MMGLSGGVDKCFQLGIANSRRFLYNYIQTLNSGRGFCLQVNVQDILLTLRLTTALDIENTWLCFLLNTPIKYLRGLKPRVRRHAIYLL